MVYYDSDPRLVSRDPSASRCGCGVVDSDNCFHVIEWAIKPHLPCTGSSSARPGSFTASVHWTAIDDDQRHIGNWT